MRLKTLILIAFACIILQPSLGDAIQNEEDDSARCRLSGLCEGFPTPGICNNKSYKDLEIPPECDDVAVQRDALLACQFDPASRAEHVRDAARWTWKGYRDCAWGWDELRPLTCSGQHWHNLTLTPVDALDTLHLMKLDKEFNEAFEVVRDELDLSTPEESNLFETTIRILGGLLSAHHLTEASHASNSNTTSLQLLNLAVDLGSRLLKAFESPSLVPYSDVNLATGSVARSVQHSSTAEATTLSLEFTLLSRLTGEAKFEEAAMAVHQALTPSVEKHGGLLPKYISPMDASTSGDGITLGARSDSYYEYLLKQWIMSGRTDDLMLTRFKEAMGAVRARLLQRTLPLIPPPPTESANHSTTRNTLENTDDSLDVDVPEVDPGYSGARRGLLYVAEEETGGTVSPKMDHLVCYLPGVLALADFYNVSTARPGTDDASDLEIAEELANTCYQMYRRTPSGLAPEIVFFQDLAATAEYPGAHESDIGGGEFIIKDADAHNLLRPETVESLFLLWKVTGNPMYQDRAWLIFRAFERWARVEGVQQCLAGNLEIVAAALSKEAAKAAAVESAHAMAAGALPEEATIQGIDASKARVHHLLTDVTDDVANQTEIVKQVSLGAAEAAATAIANTLSSLGAAARKDMFDGLGIDEAEPPVVSASWLCGNSSDLAGGGYSNLESVTQIPPPRRNKMESFWIAETLKYLYLIFVEPPDRCMHPSCADSSRTHQAVLPLTQFVFNTEAHPLPIVGPAHSSLVGIETEFDRRLLHPFTECPPEDEDQDQDEPQEEREIDEVEERADGQIEYNDEDMTDASIDSVDEVEYIGEIDQTGDVQYKDEETTTNTTQKVHDEL